MEEVKAIRMKKMNTCWVEIELKRTQEVVRSVSVEIKGRNDRDKISGLLHSMKDNGEFEGITLAEITDKTAAFFIANAAPVLCVTTKEKFQGESGWGENAFFMQDDNPQEKVV